MNGKERNQVRSINAGDIGAFVKLKNTHTGDTLSDPKTNFKLPGIDFPAPNLSGALKLKSKGEEEKKRDNETERQRAVSYTHLTLPTNREV